MVPCWPLAEPVKIQVHVFILILCLLLSLLRGVPAVVDFAAMRDAVKKLGGNPEKINPVCPADLVIDHSIQVDFNRRWGGLSLVQNLGKYVFLINKCMFRLSRWICLLLTLRTWVQSLGASWWKQRTNFCRSFSGLRSHAVHMHTYTRPHTSRVNRSMSEFKYVILRISFKDIAKKIDLSLTILG